MPRKRKPQVPGSRRQLAPGLNIASQSQAEEHYGPDVSGVIRVSGFPQRASSYIVQMQFAGGADASGWQTLAVYHTREGAELFAARREQRGMTMSDLNLRTGEMTPPAEQPVSEYRVVTLDQLAREGPKALAQAMLSLMTSDHEWIISTEIGSEAKVALYADLTGGE
jgi:hypothetical protein